jgi:hypothetical protein
LTKRYCNKNINNLFAERDRGRRDATVHEKAKNDDRIYEKRATDSYDKFASTSTKGVFCKWFDTNSTGTSTSIRDKSKSFYTNITTFWELEF